MYATLLTAVLLAQTPQSPSGTQTQTGRDAGRDAGQAAMTHNLDGNWTVERTAGLLPPLYGVHKRIEGARGVTKVGRLPGIPFEVVGLELRYRAPFRHVQPRL